MTDPNDLPDELDDATLAELELHLAAPEVAPSPHVLARLMASTGGGRFERFAARFAAIFDVTVERARELLGWVDDPSKWHPFFPGSQLVHFAAGPACAGADTGFVRVAAGQPFPEHEHLGTEWTLCLQGGAKDHTGAEFGVGDELQHDAGSAHDFVALPGEDLIYAVRVHGVRFRVPLPAHVKLES